MISPSYTVWRTTLFAVAVAVALTTSAMADEATPSHAADALAVTGAWSRATPTNAPVGAGYVTIVNNGKETDRLVGGASEVAAKVEVHEMSMANGIMTMRELPNGLAVPTASKVELKPGGYHIMFQGLKHGLKEGEHFKVTLQFEKAGPVAVDFIVGSLAAMKAPDLAAHGH